MVKIELNYKGQLLKYHLKEAWKCLKGEDQESINQIKEKEAKKWNQE